MQSLEETLRSCLLSVLNVKLPPRWAIASYLMKLKCTVFWKFISCLLIFSPMKKPAALWAAGLEFLALGFGYCGLVLQLDIERPEPQTRPSWQRPNLLQPAPQRHYLPFDLRRQYRLADLGAKCSHIGGNDRKVLCLYAFSRNECESFAQQAQVTRRSISLLGAALHHFLSATYARLNSFF